MLAYVETETQVQRRWWTCERCHARLGEVVSTSVIIVHGYRRWVAPITDEGVLAICKCGCENVLRPERTAA